MLPQAKKMILDRISVATPESPIAVFRHVQNEKIVFSAIFADTIKSRKLLAKKPSNLVGVFDRTHEPDDIKRALSI